MQIDSLGLPKYGTDDLMDLIYKGKLDMLFKVYTEDNEDTKQFNGKSCYTINTIRRCS